MFLLVTSSVCVFVFVWLFHQPLLVLNPVHWDLYNKDTTGTTVSYPVQWNLYNKDTTGTTVSYPVKWNLYSKDTTGTTINYPVYGGVLISEVLNVDMSMQEMSNGAEQWYSVKGGDCISEVYLNRGFSVYSSCTPSQAFYHMVSSAEVCFL